MSPQPSRLVPLLGLALLLAGGAARAQNVLPTGGHVVAGGATIGAPAGNNLAITQTTPRAVVNWNTFSVGQPNAVTFSQPGGTAAILNRVTGSTPSTIAGQIGANGQVYLVNPNGVAITPTGNVQVGGGFVASTLGISNQDFMGGNLNFTGNGASAPVSNAGLITAGPGGFVGLIGGTAANSGTISVPLGKVALGSGEAATLDLNGGGFLQVAVPTGATTAQGQALVTNSGRVNAAGGTVELKAATVATAIRDAVNMSGTIAATSASGRNGSITLSGGPGGAVNVTGTLDASAPAIPTSLGIPAATGNGGAVTVDGARVRIGHHAVIDASGAKGGIVLVGVSGPNGAGEADFTTIANGATILATGEPGRGGHIETSGTNLELGQALIDAGIGGSWLADPLNLTIDATAATTINTALGLGTDVTEETTAAGTIGSGTQSTGSGDIDVTSALSWSTSATLTLSAYNSIVVSAPITVSGGGTLVLTYNNASANPSSPALTFVMGEGSAQFTSESSNPSLYINNGTPGSGNGTQYTLRYSESEFVGMSSGNYALAVPLTFATTYAHSPVASFTGNVNGLGNTIANFTIGETTDGTVGLFGVLNSGTISNLGLTAESVIGTQNTSTVGGLVGTNFGAIANSFTTGTVSGESSTAIVGGLVGSNESTGTISDSYATAAVSSGAGTNVGGLVGQDIEGRIADSRATGAVTGGAGSSVGGLVGYNFLGTTGTSYATGPVSGGTGAAVGGLAGTNFFGSITHSFWDTTTNPGVTVGVGSGSDTTTAVTTAGLASGSTLTALNSGGTVWGNVNNQVTPYLLSNPGPVYLGTDPSPTPTPYTLIFTATQLQAINSHLSGSFALANSLDASGVSSWSPLGERTAFTGNFNGLGNTISDLTINDNTDTFVGLFGRLGSGGTIGNVGLIGGSVTSTFSGGFVGGLVGNNAGAITQSYAGGTISAGSGSDAGGLAGYNVGSISRSFATGPVNGGGGPVGGLVGLNDGGGTITDAYAAGAVAGSGGSVGGLVAFNLGTIADAYATGAVLGSGGARVGGLVAANVVPITGGYYDAGTTGMPLGTQGDGSVGLTTAALQSFEFADATYFLNNANWGIITGVSYPYLTFFYPTTPQVVSGTVFQDQGSTPAGPGIAVSGLVGGTGIGTVGTGANGYYYYLLPANTIPSGGGVLTYAQNYAAGGGTASGAAFADGVTGGAAIGVTVLANTLHEITPDGANSTLQANLATAVGSNATASSLLPILSNLQIDASAATFDVDSAISHPVGTVTLNAAGGITESTGTITADALGIAAGGSVDLPGANLVNTLAASVTGAGAIFDFSNAQSLTIGAVGSLAGVTTNGTDGSAANIVLRTTVGDLDIEEPVSTNGANGAVLGASTGLIGLQAAGNLLMNQSGFDGHLVGYGVEAIAGGTISLDGSSTVTGNRIGGNDDSRGIAQIAGLFSAEATGAGSPIIFTSTDAPLTVGAVSSGSGIGVSAGSITLPLVSGVYANGGEIDISSLASSPLTLTETFALTLDQPVSANNFASGSPTSVLQGTPGLVRLIAQGGDLTQSANGVILAGQLYAKADGGANYESARGGNVTLTAANRLGANDVGGIAQDAGLLAGFANGDFKFVSHNAPLTIDTLTCGCAGIFSYFGDIELATTGAGAITVNKPVKAGTNINIAAAPGYGFTNNASDDFLFDSENGLGFTFGLDTTAGGGSLTILADQMSLANGTIGAGSGIVVLAPATPTDNIVLGAAGSTGTLGLQQADLSTIGGGALQIGYRNPDGTPSLGSNITIAGDITFDTDSNVAGLLLVTGGSVTEAGGGIIGTGSSALQLGIIASGTNTLTAADNNIGRIAAYVDGTDPSLSFTNAAALRVGTLSGFEAGISVDANGLPSATPISGSISDPLSGIVTAGGVATTGGVTLTTTTGGITVFAPISTGAQPIELSAAGGIAFSDTVTTTGTLTATAGAARGSAVGITQNGSGVLTVSGGSNFTDESTGGAITLTDSNALGGTVSLNTTGAGGTATLVNGIPLTLGASTLGDNLTVTATGGLTVTGAVSSPGTIALTAVPGSGAAVLTFASGANVGAPTIDLDASSIAISGTAILGQSGATIDLANASSTGGVTEDPTAEIIAATLKATNGLSGAASLVGTANEVQGLEAITVSGSGNGFALVTTTPLVVGGALTTASGPVSLTTTGAGSNLTLIGSISAPGNTITLASGGRIGQGTAAVITANLLTGSSVGGTQLTGPNQVAVFGPFTDTGNGFIAFTDSQSFAVAGTIGAGAGSITLTTTGPNENLTLGNGGGPTDGSLTTGAFVELDINGTITQASGTITASGLDGSSVGGASFAQANAISGSFGPFTNTASGDVSFTNAGAIEITGVTNTAGDIALTTTSGDLDLAPTTALTASPTGTVTLVSGGGIESPGGPGTYATISAGSLSVTAAGPVGLPGANTVNTLAADVTGAGATFGFSNAQTLTVGTVGGLSGVTTNGTDGSEANIVLQTTAGDLYINEPVSTNGANGTTLGLSIGQIGLQASGQLILNKSGTSGNLIGFAVEAIAGGTLNLDGSTNPVGNRIGGNDVGGVAQTAGTFSGETTGPGANLVFNDTNAPLTIDQVSVGGGLGVAAGSLSLPLISGVYSNGGTIALDSLGSGGTFGLTLNQPVNANNFVGGSPSTMLQGTPGFVELYAEAGDLTQSSAGIVLASQLFAESYGGNVLLTAANRIGANDNGGVAQTAGLLAGVSDDDFKFVNHNAPLTISTVSCTACEGIFANLGGIDLATTGAGAITVNKPVNSGVGINIAVAPGYGFTNNASDDPSFDTYFGLTTTGTAGLDTSYAAAPIAILADQISLSGGTINTRGAPLVLGPATPTTNIILAGGTVPAGTLGLQTADFAGVQAGLVQIGYRNPDGTVSMTGNITIAGDLAINTAKIGELMLMTGGSVGETGGGAITGSSAGTLQLGIVAGGANNLTGANNIGTLAAYIDGTNPSLSFTNAGVLRVGTLSDVQAGVSLDSDGFPDPTPLRGAPANPLSGIAAAGGVTLATTGAGSNIALTAPISAPGKSVTLVSGGTITQSSGATITAASLDGSSVGNATLTEANAVGSLGPFTATGGTLSFDDTVNLTIGGALSAGTSIVVATIGPDPNLVIAADMTAPTVTLAATGSITQNSGTTIAATNLAAATQLDAGGAISLASATNAVTGDVTLTSLNFAGTQLAGGAITFTDSTGFTIASLGGLQGGIGTTGTASLRAGGRIGEASEASIAAATLSGGSVGGATLAGANAVANLGSWADTGSGSVGLTLADSEALTVAGGSVVSSATGPVTLAVTGGDLTLGSASSVSGNGVVLATTGNFINGSGAAALMATAGSRWLVYSAAPAGDIFGNLDSGNTAIWNATYTSLPPASVTQGGNRYLFAQGQTLTVTSTSDSKTYGADAAAQVANDYIVTGYAPGVANAFLGDTAATAYTGTPSATSAGSAATATVAGGPYPITVTAGTMAGADGYAVTFGSGGTLTVTPATLTAALTGSTGKVYDGTNAATLAADNYTLSGIVNGDTVTLNDPTSGTYATPDVGTGIGVTATGLAIAGSGAGNYTLAGTTASGNIGTITPAPLAVTANDLFRLRAQPNPPLTDTITAGTFFGGDILSGALATAADVDSPVGAYPITQGTLAASANYTLTFVDGVLTISVPATGASPLMYADTGWGWSAGTGGTKPRLPPCRPDSIAARLNANGQVTLYGAGACGTP